MSAKRRFGRVRKLPSGRWQVRYKGPDGLDRPAPRTFPTKRDAEVWLTKTEADMLADDWLDPDLGRVVFGDYASAWIDERPGLRPKTVQLYATCCASTSFLPSAASHSLPSGSRMYAAGARACWMMARARSPRQRRMACSKPSSTRPLMTA